LIGPKSEVDGSVLTGKNVQFKCSAAISMTAVIKYEDIFGRPHITEACQFIRSIDEFKSFPAGQSVSVGAEACNEHNCADEECGADWKERALE
jgi:hypothetical protein